MKVTVLGCGTSGGVPRLPNRWGACDPANPKIRRRRCSILLQQEGFHLLVDTGPDLRDQLLDAAVGHLDAVLYTHDHADHTHGIDDLRYYAYARPPDRRLPVYAAPQTLDVLIQRFDYIFDSKNGYPAICDAHPIDGGFDLGPFHIEPFLQSHGATTSLGFRFGDFAYSTDVNQLDEAAFAVLGGVKVWIVDALRYEPHPSHAHLDRTLDWIGRVSPDQAYLTHMTWDMDYEALCRDLPAGVAPAYDGLTITCD